MMTLRTVLASALAAGLLAAQPGHAAPLDWAAQVASQTEGKRLLLIGEMHGSNEAPALAADLADRWTRPLPNGDRGPAVIVGLEYPLSEISALTRYVDSDGAEIEKRRLLASPFWSRDYQDGRSSQAMFALVETVRVLRKSGRNVQLTAFDMNDEQRAAKRNRDAAMADNLRAAIMENPSARFIVLTGNYHARQSVGARWDARYRFMTNYLIDLSPYSLNVEAMRGAYWNCSGPQVADCKVVHFARDPADTHAPGVWVDESTRQAGYDQSLMLDQMSASLPARDLN
jgi:erythromycin esterase-like protein